MKADGEDGRLFAFVSLYVSRLLVFQQLSHADGTRDGVTRTRTAFAKADLDNKERKTKNISSYVLFT